MSASEATLTVELFTEELPPKALKRLGEAFTEGVVNGLRNRGFLQAATGWKPFATPRRLAVTITHVLATSPDTALTQKLMPAAVAVDETGKPTAALRKKLAALGRAHLADLWPDAADGPDRLTRESDGKADALFLHMVAKGSPLQQGLEEALDETLAKLPIPKVMSYAGAGSYYSDVKFVRPAHRLLALHGAAVVPVKALGLTAAATLIGLGAALALGVDAFLIGVLFWLIGVLYNWRYKQSGLPGNLMVSTSVASTFLESLGFLVEAVALVLFALRAVLVGQ